MAGETAEVIRDDGFTEEEAAELEAGATEEGAEAAPELPLEEEKAAEDVVEEREAGAKKGAEAEEAPPGDAPQKKADGAPPGYVPTVAIQQVREELKATKERSERMEQAFQHFLTQEQQKQQAAAEAAQQAQIPTFEDDPIGANQAQLYATQQRQLQLEQRFAKQEEEASQQVKQRQIMGSYAAACDEYTKSTAPDFMDAYRFLEKSVDDELALRGIDNPQERINAMQFEEGRVLGRAMSAGRNPAEMVYNLAKGRGYKGPAPTEPAAPGEPAAPTKLETIESGQKVAKSVNSGAAPPNDSISLSRLSDLYDTDPEAADEMYNKMRARGML